MNATQMGKKYRKIYLRNKRMFTLVDEADYKRAKQFNWFAHYAKKTNGYYAKRQSSKILGKQTTISLHRWITKATKRFVVDHINHNTLDNRRKNLRICSRKNNTRNRSLRRDSKTGFRGVNWRERDKAFVARIGVNGRLISLGYFKSLKEAAAAYKKASIKYFKKFSPV